MRIPISQESGMTLWLVQHSALSGRPTHRCKCTCMEGLQEASLFHSCSEMGITPLRRSRHSFESRKLNTIDGSWLGRRGPDQPSTPTRAHDWSLLGRPDDGLVKRSTEDMAGIVFLLSFFLTIILWLLGVELPPAGRPL